MFTIIVIIAAVIIVFRVISRDSGEVSPKLQEDRIKESVVNAIVKSKDVSESGFRRSHRPAYFITFDCEDEVTREFEVSLKLYEEIGIGERDELVYAGDSLLGFGDYGAIESDSGPIEEDGFTYDDYDENVDVELYDDTPADTGGLDSENQEWFERFNKRERLPSKTESVEDEADSLQDYSADALFEKLTVYPFLKRNDSVRRMFFKTYDEAMTDLLGFAGNSRKGASADSDFINKNEIRVYITIQENQWPIRSKITAEFGVNE